MSEESGRTPSMREALEWAIAEIDGHTRYDREEQRVNALACAKAALAKLREDAEPVAWMNADHIEAYRQRVTDDIAWSSGKQTGYYTVPLYLHPTEQTDARSGVREDAWLVTNGPDGLCSKVVSGFENLKREVVAAVFGDASDASEEAQDMRDRLDTLGEWEGDRRWSISWSFEDGYLNVQRITDLSSLSALSPADEPVAQQESEPVAWTQPSALLAVKGGAAGHMWSRRNEDAVRKLLDIQMPDDVPLYTHPPADEPVAAPDPTPRDDDIPRIYEDAVAPQEGEAVAVDYFIQERDDDMLICAKHWQFGSVCIARRPKLAENDVWRPTAEKIIAALTHPPAAQAGARVEALRLLAAEDARQDKLQEILETVREQIRLGVAAEQRPEGLFKNIQDAVYAMRGRTRLMDDAALTAALAQEGK